MGKLVNFDRRRKPTSAGKRSPGDAQILMFTGVRYERGTPPSPSKTMGPPRPKRKRG